MSVQKVINSFKYLLENIDGLNCFIYTDSKVDLDTVYQARVKSNIAGTVKNFIVQLYVANNWYDAIGNNQTYNLLKRYVKFTTSLGAVKYILIDNYNVLTGEITLSEAFGEAMTPANTFEIVILDSIFIKEQQVSDRGNSNKFNHKFVRIYTYIKTKDDSSRSKTRTFQDLMSSEIGKYLNMTIYNDNLITKLGYARFDDNGTYNEGVDSSDQMISYNGSFPVHYYVDNLQ
jgi:hypothetical protein